MTVSNRKPTTHTATNAAADDAASTTSSNLTAPSVASKAEKSHRRRQVCFSKLHPLVTLLLLLCVVGQQLVLWQTHTRGLYESTAMATTPKQQRLGDGCYHVFLDVGANIGVHGRFLLEPAKYPDSVSSVELLKKEYHLRDNRDVCVFAFEANPRHWPRLQTVAQAYAKRNWRYHVVEAAVSDFGGTHTFFHQGSKDEESNEWGFSGAKDLRGNYMGEPSVGGFTEEVPTVRLSEWINHHIHGRSIPDQPHDAATTKPILGMKMDIEGFEYVVLPDLIHTGALCHFDFVFGEFHTMFVPVRQFRNSSEVDTERFHRQPLETAQDADYYAAALATVVQAARHCPVRYLWSDDESYLHDGQPLPEAVAAQQTNHQPPAASS